MVIASITLARTEVASKKTHISNNHLLVINPYADFMTKTSIRKFALELRYSNMIIVARITFIYQWLLSNFSFLQNGKKIPSMDTLQNLPKYYEHPLNETSNWTRRRHPWRNHNLTKLQGENITNERRLHSRTPDDNRSTWTHGRWITEFLKGRGDIYTGVTLTIATTSFTKNREPRWPPY